MRLMISFIQPRLSKTLEKFMENQSNLYVAQARGINSLPVILQLWFWAWHPVFSGAGLTGMPFRYGDFLDLC
jgi:hypothetical protein